MSFDLYEGCYKKIFIFVSQVANILLCILLRAADSKSLWEYAQVTPSVQQGDPPDSLMGRPTWQDCGVTVNDQLLLSVQFLSCTFSFLP